MMAEWSGGGESFGCHIGKNCSPDLPPLRDDLEGHDDCAFHQIFAGAVTIIEKVKPADYKWGATTRKNEITIFVPCDVFFNDPDTYLEEYYHVLEQWNTRRLSRLKYAWEYLRHGYDNNKYENEAKDWVKRHRDDFKKCLNCQQSK